MKKAKQNTVGGQNCAEQIFASNITHQSQKVGLEISKY